MGKKQPKEKNIHHYSDEDRDSPELEYLNCCQLKTHQKKIIAARHADGIIDPTFRGPLKNRSCTDVICLFIFVIFLVVWIAIGIYAFKDGSFGEIFAPRDSNNKKCGYDPGFEDKPYLIFFDLTKCIVPKTDVFHCDTPQVCIKECPQENFYVNFYQENNYDPKLVANKLVCVDSVNTSTIKTWYGPDGISDYITKRLCAPWYLQSMSVGNRCLPDLFLNNGTSNIIIDIANKNITIDGVNGSDLLEATKVVQIITAVKDFWQGSVKDLIEVWPWIVVCVVGAMVVCLIYIFIMRWFAGTMIWFSLLGSIALLSYCVYICWSKYDEINKASEETEIRAAVTSLSTRDILSGALNEQWQHLMSLKETWLALLIITSIVLVILLIIIIFLRARILLAIALINEGSKAVGQSWGALVFPIFPWILQMGVILYGGAIFLYLFTSGVAVYKVVGLSNDTGCICNNSYHDGSLCLVEEFNKSCKNNGQACLTAGCMFDQHESNNFDIYLQLYNLFMFLWSLFFVSALGQMILASVFATYYFTFHKGDVPFFIVASSAWRVMRYHLGTIAFGSLLLAFVRWLRVVFELADSQLKKYDNPFTRAIKCCLRCFFWCLEKFLRFLNKNAYIMCAIHGKNFCASAAEAFSLLLKNIVRVFVLDKVTDFLFFMSKLLITAAVGAASFYIFSNPVKDLKNLSSSPYETNYYFVPIFISCVGAYFIATLFFDVYSMAVDTLFLCFLHDCEVNNGSKEKPYFMSKNLMSLLNKKNKD